MTSITAAISSPVNTPLLKGSGYAEGLRHKIVDFVKRTFSSTMTTKRSELIIDFSGVRLGECCFLITQGMFIDSKYKVESSTFFGTIKKIGSYLLAGLDWFGVKKDQIQSAIRKDFEGANQAEWEIFQGSFQGIGTSFVLISYLLINFIQSPLFNKHSIAILLSLLSFYTPFLLFSAAFFGLYLSSRAIIRTRSFLKNNEEFFSVNNQAPDEMIKKLRNLQKMVSVSPLEFNRIEKMNDLSMSQEIQKLIEARIAVFIRRFGEKAFYSVLQSDAIIKKLESVDPEIRKQGLFEANHLISTIRGRGYKKMLMDSSTFVAYVLSILSLIALFNLPFFFVYLGLTLASTAFSIGSAALYYQDTKNDKIRDATQSQLMNKLVKTEDDITHPPLGYTPHPSFE